MSTKLQVVVPIDPDPLLCQLYFRNYAKYKQQYVDRLIIIVKNHPIYSRFIKDINGNVIRSIIYNQSEYTSKLSEMEDLLTELNIKNYTVIYSPSGGHARMFHSAINEIYDKNYHTLFDEQDAFWLNDNFKQFVDQLNEFDLIGGIKGRIEYLETSEQLEKFNKRFGLNHKNQLYTIYLPEFLSNRIIQKIENFSCDSAELNDNYDPTSYCDQSDSKDTKIVILDTFQPLNIEIFKNTDRVKLISNSEWDIINELSNKKDPLNFEKHVVYHMGFSIWFIWMTFFKLCDQEDLNENFYHSCRAGYQLRCSFLYQTIDRIKGFKYITQYKKNIETGCEVNRVKMNLSDYNCHKLIDRIL